MGDYLVGDLQDDIGSGHRVVATVFVEGGTQRRTEGPVSMRPVGETEFVVRSIRDVGAGLCAGIVGFADLELGERVRPVLEAQIRAAEGRFRGVRFPLRWDPTGIGMWRKEYSASRMREPGFRNGLKQLADLGLSFDAFVYHHQLDALAQLARDFPETTLIVNHIGGPLGAGQYAGRQAEVFANWTSGLDSLARHPNVFMKLGGLGMLYSGFHFYRQATPPTSTQLAEAWRPYMEACIERFGVDRCMFESNFPVDKQTCTYGTLWNAFKRITQNASTSEKAALYLGTGARAYKLKVMS